MFRGPRGSGKTSVARILAKAANCENLKGFTTCGKCTGCRYALHDSEEIDAASNRGIDDIKELIDTEGLDDKELLANDKVALRPVRQAGRPPKWSFNAPIGPSVCCRRTA